MKYTKAPGEFKSASLFSNYSTFFSLVHSPLIQFYWGTLCVVHWHTGLKGNQNDKTFTIAVSALNMNIVEFSTNPQQPTFTVFKLFRLHFHWCLRCVFICLSIKSEPISQALRKLMGVYIYTYRDALMILLSKMLLTQSYKVRPKERKNDNWSMSVSRLKKIIWEFQWPQNKMKTNSAFCCC